MVVVVSDKGRIGGDVGFFVGFFDGFFVGNLLLCMKEEDAKINVSLEGKSHNQILKV